MGERRRNSDVAIPTISFAVNRLQRRTKMSSKKFEDIQAFLAWMNLSNGETLTFPLATAKGWSVVVGGENGAKIVSGFYGVRSLPPYGAPKIFGIRYPFGESECSGVIEFGFVDGKAAVTNRRRVTEHDSLAENQSLLIVIQAQPDRVDEPVAVVINNNDEGHLKAMTSEAWLELFDGVRDALELLAVRELKKAFATAA